MLEGGGLLFAAEEREEIGQDVFQAAVQFQHFADGFLSPRPLFILWLNLQVALEQFDHRQIRRRFAMRDGKGFEHEAPTLRGESEFIEQA